MSAWPFKQLTPQRWASLTLADQLRAEGAALMMLEEIEAMRAQARVRAKTRRPLLRLVEPPDQIEPEHAQ